MERGGEGRGRMGGTERRRGKGLRGRERERERERGREREGESERRPTEGRGEERRGAETGFPDLPLDAHAEY